MNSKALLSLVLGEKLIIADTSFIGLLTTLHRYKIENDTLRSIKSRATDKIPQCRLVNDN